MASKSVWSGALTLGPMLTLHLEATKATDKYAGSQKLVEVCSCHLQPFARTTVCATSGKARDAGMMVKAVEKPDGTFAQVDDSAITAAMVKEMVPLAVVSRSDLPIYAISDFWRLRPSKKVPGSGQAVAYVLAWLSARDVAVVARYPYSGHQHIVSLLAVDGALGMVRLRYEQELREVEPEHRPSDQQGQPFLVPGRALTLIDEVVSELPTNLNLAVMEDASVRERATLIAQVIGGEAPTRPAETAASEPAVPDLMAALEGAMSNKPKAKKASPASAPKVKA